MQKQADVKKLWKIAVDLQEKIAENFHPSLYSYFEEVKKLMDSVALTKFDKVKQEVSIVYVWRSAEEFNKRIVCANEEIRKNWSMIYEFLKNDLAKEAIEKEKERQSKEENKWETLAKIQEENKLETVWSTDIPRNDKGEIDFRIPYQIPNVQRMIYGTNSGWGNHNYVSLPESPTYLDVYKAANKVIEKSGDTHHIFIEGFHVEGNTLTVITGS